MSRRSSPEALSSTPSASSLSRSLSLMSDAEEVSFGIRPSFTPSRMTYLTFSPQTRSMLPQLTRSSETGMLPTE